MSQNNLPLLDIQDLSVEFSTADGNISVTDKVNFSIQHGEIYGLVGESGCGKSITALAILKLLPEPVGRVVEGKVFFEGKNILEMSAESLTALRGAEISMIFQEPTAAMNPLYTIKAQLMECFDYHLFEGNKKERVEALLKKVGLSDTKRILSAYPHELSGGMLQRVMIAMALLLKPKLIIADEPTTALDVTIQVQILELLIGLQKEFDTSILLITHNLGLIAQYADRVGVMYAGRIVEEAPVPLFLKGPSHPYAQGLMRAIPDIQQSTPTLKPIPGQVPQAKDFLSGCRFKERCPEVMDQCSFKPELLEIESSHRVACFLCNTREVD